MSAYLTIRCACGTTTRASALLAGGPIPCDECGRANQHKIRTKDGVGSSKRKTGPTKRPAGARALADRPRRSVRRGRATANYEKSLVTLGVALAIASAAAFLLQAGGPKPLGAGWYILGSLLATGIDLGVIVVGAAVLGLSVGTLVEGGFKIALIVQVSGVVAGGALLLGGPATLFAALVLFLGIPALLVKLFDWSWGEAILVFVGQMVCHWGVLQAIQSAAR